MTRFGDVPEIIGQYLRADRARDTDAVVATFASDAEVHDDGQDHRGTEAIRSWREGPANRYRYDVEILGVHATSDDRHVVRTRLTGDFPGGTVDLDMGFTLDGDLISALAIATAADADAEQRNARPNIR